MSKKSPRSWTGIPLARKSRIFGLHSIPANTTPVLLKNSFLSYFSLKRCFSAAPVSGKTKCGGTAAKIEFRIYRETKNLLHEARGFCRFKLVREVSVLEVPVAIRAVPCALEAGALEPEIVVVSNRDKSVIFAYDLLCLVESSKVSSLVCHLRVVHRYEPFRTHRRGAWV